MLFITAAEKLFVLILFQSAYKYRKREEVALCMDKQREGRQGK